MVERRDIPENDGASSPEWDATPDFSHVRSALRMLLDRPGGLLPEQREAAAAEVSAKTADVARGIGEILLHRVRMMLQRALHCYIDQHYHLVDERPPAGIYARLDRAIEAAVPPHAAAGLVPYLAAREGEIYWADKEMENAMHCFRATWARVSDEAELPGMLAPEFSEAADLVDECFILLLDGDDAGAAGALHAMAGRPVDPELEACLCRRRAVYERLLLEQGVLYAQDRREQEWAAAEAESEPQTSTVDSDSATRFLRRLAALHRGRKLDTITQFTPRYHRAGNLLGLPEYDLPIARLQKWSPAEIAALAEACAGLASSDGPDRAFFEDLSCSFELLRERDTDEYRYEADPFAVVAARFRRLQPPSNPKKWIDVTEAATARPEAAEAILDTLGYLPEAMFRDVRDPAKVNQTFGKKLAFQRVIALHHALEQMLGPRRERPTATYTDFALLDAQGLVLESLLLSERMEKLAISASVDVQGLYVTLQQRGGGGSEADFSFHLPFRCVSEEICARLLARGALTEGDVEELRQERAGVLHDRDQVADIDRRKEATAARHLGLSAGEAGREIAARLRDPAKHLTLVQAMQPNMDEIVRLPQSATARVVREALGDPAALREATGALVRYAALIQRRCSRKKGMSDPRNYEAMRAVIMPMLRELATDYRTKKTSGLRHCFVNRPRRRQLLALWPEGDDSAAVLIDLDKFPEDHFQLATAYSRGGPTKELSDFGAGPWGS